MEYFTIEKTIVLDERKDSFFIGQAFDSNHEKVKIKRGGFQEGGKSLKQLFTSPITLIVNEKNSYHGNFHEVLYTSSNLGQILLFHKEIKDAIEAVCPQDIEFFQVHTKSNKADRNDYFAMNIVNRIDCIDTKQSQFIEDYGFLTKFTSLVLDETKIPSEVKIFTVDKTFPGFPPIFREEIVQIFRDRKVKGAKFTPIKEFTGG